MKGRRVKGSLQIAVFWLMAVSVWSLARASDGRDDFDTDHAREIIRISKLAEMKNMLNTDVSPCVDFYGYACGNWHRQNPAQLFGSIMTDTFNLIAEGFDRRLKKLLRSKTASSNLEKNLQTFFNSCLLTGDKGPHHKQALQSIYREFGKFPLVDGSEWIASNFSWWRTAADIQRKYKREIILAVDIMPDLANNTVNRIYLSPPDNDRVLNIGNIFEDASTTEQIIDHLAVDQQRAKQAAKAINKLRRELAAGEVTQGATLMDDLTLFKVSDLETKYIDRMNITEYLGLVLGSENVPDEIFVYNEHYLNHTLQTLQRTAEETIANFVLWELLEPYRAGAKSAESERIEWCVTQTKKHFGKLTDHLIYERYRNAEREAEVHSVWREVRDTFRQQLAGDKLDWITNGTREEAIRKLDRMQLYINAYDNEDFEGLYGDLAMDSINYVRNVQQLLALEANRKLERLHKPASPLEDTETLSFTPAYSIQANNITIPVALLQPRYFWGKEYPQALKYATLGYLLAHEMIHGFDDEGRMYDAEGNLAAWWDEKSQYEFEEKRKCFQKQYHDFKYNNAQLPDMVQQSENIADNGGVKLAYMAYQRWLAGQPPEVLQRETFPGFQLNNRQLFFVSFAQLWCEEVQSMFKTTLAETDSHAPSKFRVIGPLSNFQEFSWVFNCSQKAPMDPDFKCAIY